MAQNGNGRPRAQWGAAAVLGAFSLGLVGFWCLTLEAGIWDDAYISMTAARNLLRGAGLHFNPELGDYAVSTLAWPLILAFGGLFSADLVTVVRVAGFLSQLLLAITFGLLALEVTRSRVGAVVGVALLLTNPVVVLCSQWGMETALYMALVSAATLALVTGRPSLCLLVAAGLVWIRVDGIAFYGVALALVLTDCFTRWPSRRDGLRALPSVLFAGAYFVCGELYFGRPIADSVTTKWGIEIPLDWGTLTSAIAREFLRALAGRSSYWLTETTAHAWLAPFAILGLAALRDRRLRRALALPGLFALAYAASFIASTRIYATNFPWYFAPPLAVFVLLALLGLRELGRLLSRLVPSGRWDAPARRGAAWAVGCAVAVAWTALVHGPMQTDAAALRHREACRERLYGAASSWAGRPLPAIGERFLAADEIGAVGYFAPPAVGVLDLVGLSRRRGGDPASSFRELRPAAVVTATAQWPRVIDQELGGDYVWLRPAVECARPLLVGLRRDLARREIWDRAGLEASLGEQASEVRARRRERAEAEEGMR